MKVERRNFLLLLGCLMLVLSLTLALTMQLERSPQMQRNTNGVQTAKDKQINLQEVMDSAIDMMSRGNFSAAEAVLADAVKQYPGQSDLWMLLGEAYYRQEKFAQAEQTFRHLLRYQPENAAGYNNLAESLIKLERFQEAQTAINQAIQLAPKNGEILLNAASLMTSASGEGINALKSSTPLVKRKRRSATTVILHSILSKRTLISR